MTTIFHPKYEKEYGTPLDGPHIKLTPVKKTHATAEGELTQHTHTKIGKAMGEVFVEDGDTGVDLRGTETPSRAVEMAAKSRKETRDLHLPHNMNVSEFLNAVADVVVDPWQAGVGEICRVYRAALDVCSRIDIFIEGDKMPRMINEALRGRPAKEIAAEYTAAKLAEWAEKEKARPRPAAKPPNMWKRVAGLFTGSGTNASPRAQTDGTRS